MYYIKALAYSLKESLPDLEPNLRSVPYTMCDYTHCATWRLFSYYAMHTSINAVNEVGIWNVMGRP